MKRAASLLLGLGFGIALAWGTAGCGPGGADSPATAPDGASAAPAGADGAGLSIVSLNLGESGENRELAPGAADARRDAVAALVRRETPDALFLRGLLSEAELDGIRKALADGGLDYAHRAFLPDENHVCSQGILARVPLSVRESTGHPSFVVGSEDAQMLRGVLDVDLGGVRVLAAHLKSKSFHPLRQSEFRRSEARALAHCVRDALSGDPAAPLLVLGTLNDTPSSAVVRRVQGILADAPGPVLDDLRPVDALGAAWTHAEPDDVFARNDYLLASDALRPRVASVAVLHAPDVLAATKNRPLSIVLRATAPAPAR